MRLTIAIAVLFLSTTDTSAFKCPIKEIRHYASYPWSKALVGNERGCTSLYDNRLTRKEAIKAALAKCKHDFGKTCHVVKSVGY
jgi:hypothetical protein